MKIFESEIVEVTTKDLNNLRGQELKFKALFDKKYHRYSRVWSWKHFGYLHKLELHNLPLE